MKMSSFVNPPHTYYFDTIKMWNEQLFQKLAQATTKKEATPIKQAIVKEMKKSEMPKMIVKDMIQYIRSI